MKINSFIEKAKQKHGDKYDYGKVEYNGSLEPVCIICPEHGEFWQRPVTHLRGSGCPKCSNKNRGKKSNDTKKIIEKFISIHGDKYDYSKVEYVSANEKVCIICPQHGEFYQLPYSHIKGSGCPKCKARNLSKNEVISKCNEVHGNRYDYSKVEYNKLKDKVTIICPEHGEFYQSMEKHLHGQGCPKCAKEKSVKKIAIRFNEFVLRANKVHKNKYEYCEEAYNKLKDKVTIICPKHGEFWQLASDHLNGHGCPRCGNNLSVAEDEIIDYIQKLLPSTKIIHNDRTVIAPKELDIYIPEKRIAIEYNGLRWHSEEYGKDKYYHLNKTLECEKKGIILYQIFEDEYLLHKDIVLSKLKRILGYDEDIIKIGARKTIIKEIDNETAKEFLNKNHIQGFVQSSVYLGAYYMDLLVSVICFMKISDGEWNLVRFASNINYNIQGVCSKFIKYFTTRYSVSLIKTFLDRRWCRSINNNVYTKSGFKLDSIIKPDYRYVKSDIVNRFHKFNFRKQILLKKYPQLLNINMTETEMTKQLGYHKIYDCGLFKYVWKNK